MIGPVTSAATGLADARPKDVRSEKLVVRLSDLKPDLRQLHMLNKPALYEALLRAHFPSTAKITQETDGVLAFRVDGLRGFVTEEQNRWETLTVTFYPSMDETEATLTGTAWGAHVLKEGSEPPKKEAYRNYLYPDYEKPLKTHLGTLMAKLGAQLRQ